MTDDEKKLVHRFTELAERSFSGGIYTETEFLAPAEQALLKTNIRHVPYSFYGGYPDAEKAMALFGSEELCGYEAEPPIVFLQISPTSLKFSEALSHRDFLGAILSLGIRRSVLGDLIVKENRAYTVCLESIADYLCENVVSVRHTSVCCERISSFPEDVLPVPLESSFVVMSERLDSVIAAIYKISRSESKDLIEHEKVLVGGAAELRADYHPEPDDIITVKSKGKFLYCGMEQETKKGRLRCRAKIYQ